MASKSDHFDERRFVNPTGTAGQQFSKVPRMLREPRWFMQAVHMNPAEAVQAHVDLEAAQSIAMHFGTFQLTTEGRDEPLRALEDACLAKQMSQSRFRTLGFGKSIRLDAGGDRARVTQMLDITQRVV